MRRQVIALVVLGSVAFAGCRSRVQYGSARYGGPSVAPPQVSAQVGPSRWFPVQQPNAGFTCRMPAMPHLETETGYSEDGATYQSVRVRADAPFGTFAVFVTQWEGGVVGDPLSIARGLAASILEHTDTPDHRVTRVTIPGFYAREDTGHTGNGSFFAFRQFFGRDRIYVAVTSVQNDPTGLRAAEEFMRSIALDRRDALLPYGDSTTPVPLYLPDVDFAAHMPPIASRRSSEIDVDGETTDAWVFESRHASGVYRVTVVPFEHGVPESALEHVAEALSLGTSERYIDASGYPGRTYRASGDRRARAFVTRYRVYALEVTGASAIGDAGADAFFDSFRIL